MNTKKTYPPTYTTASPTTSMANRARRAPKCAELGIVSTSARRPSPARRLASPQSDARAPLADVGGSRARERETTAGRRARRGRERVR